MRDSEGERWVWRVYAKVGGEWQPLSPAHPTMKAAQAAQKAVKLETRIVCELESK